MTAWRCLKKMCEAPEFLQIAALATVSYDDAQRMDATERTALLFARHINAGATVDWRTGRITYPKPGGG